MSGSEINLYASPRNSIVWPRGRIRGANEIHRKSGCRTGHIGAGPAARRAAVQIPIRPKPGRRCAPWLSGSTPSAASATNISRRPCSASRPGTCSSPCSSPATTAAPSRSSEAYQAARVDERHGPTLIEKLIASGLVARSHNRGNAVRLTDHGMDRLSDYLADLV